MSLTVIAIASLHAALPWIAGQQTKKMRWVVVATCIACYTALIVGNGAYVIVDLLAAGVGFFIGRAYVTPRSERKKLPNSASTAKRKTENIRKTKTQPTGPALKAWVRPKKVMANHSKTARDSDLAQNHIVACPAQIVSHSSSEEPAVAVCAVVCPYCNTMFRFAPDQLRVRGGIVRCGACQEIFDGSATLQYL